ncbi:MAG: type II toxin-antitoxin system VapC family toxin [Actinomycetota bacterium]|nr:type II toxin-antitoxin system VapC family toxin [Actinomycetota bacterium]
MIVIDASALVEVLLQTPRAGAVERCMRGHELVAPDALDGEVLHALRGLERGGKATPQRVNRAIVRLGELPVDRVAIAVLHQEVWALRHALSMYDAAYVAVAQRLDCALLTLDRRLAAGAPGGVPVTAL